MNLTWITTPSISTCLCSRICIWTKIMLTAIITLSGISICQMLSSICIIRTRKARKTAEMSHSSRPQSSFNSISITNIWRLKLWSTISPRKLRRIKESKVSNLNQNWESFRWISISLNMAQTRTILQKFTGIKRRTLGEKRSTAPTSCLS
jgi:hypothetical protein